MRIHFPNCILQVMSLAICLLLIACSSAPATTSRGSPSITAVIAPTVEPNPPIYFTEIKATRPWRIAFIPKYTNFNEPGEMSPYWQVAWQGTQKTGLDFGVIVKLVTSDVRGSADAENVEPQVRLVADLIAQGDLDGLVIAPFDSNRLAPVVDKAITAGVPTVAMDTSVNSERLLTFVVIDNFTAGQVLGEWVAQQLGGKGKALILDGSQNQQNAVDRRKGFLTGLQTENIDILDTESAGWDIEPARHITAAWLQKYADVNVILAAIDDMAIGAAQAVAEAKRSGILITGFAATHTGLTAIKDGQISATVDQAPGEPARLAIQLLVRHLETGETFPSIIFLPRIPLVTKENVGIYLSQNGLK
jgi:ribose transport system substrate-binding protein